MKNFVGSHFLLAVFLYVSNMSEGNSQLDETCPKSGESCIKNETIMFVDPGSDVIIKCICSTEIKGGVTGPVISSLIDMGNSDHFPYTDGSVLNSNLNTTKYMVVVHFNKNECNLKIVKFSREEEGIYKCQYQSMNKIAIHVYTIAMKRPPSNLRIVNLTNNTILNWRGGKLLTLVCQVQSGIPPEQLQWISKGNIIESGGPGLLNYSFIPSKNDNAQLIACLAIHPLLLPSFKQEVFLNISYKPFITIPVKSNKSYIEGTHGIICCNVESNPPVFLTTWLKNNGKFQVMNGKNNCLEFTAFQRSHAGHYTCLAENTLGKSNSSYELNILYPPKVIVKYTIEHDYIKFECNAYGEPKNYTFLPWEHQSKYHEHIRYLNGNRSGTLCVQRTKNLNQNQFEDNGYYICRVYNGFPVAGRNKTQEGKVYIILKVPPVFLLENRYIQYGAYGSEVKLWVEIYSDTKVLSKHIRRYETNQNIEAHAQEKIVTGHVLSHRVRVTVLGTRLTFKVYMERKDDFNNYTIIVCNTEGCTSITIEVRSSNNNTDSMIGNNSSWQILGSVFGGSLFISLCWNIYCFFKRKKKSGIHTIVPLEVQYDEIGDISFTSGHIQGLQNNAQESISSVNLPSLEGTRNIISSSEKSSSEHSQSISLLNEDGYEHPYQTIDLGSIEIHPYSAIWSNLYQNTTVFPNRITTNYEQKHNPWLIIYNKSITLDFQDPSTHHEK
ncbi:titin-like [Mytilus edulis]|uniref:titin-like n=1 Tax=Mytilus edulis TaxID=6550 RepID=UPI0039EFA6DE